MRMSNKERQSRYLAASREAGGERLQIMISSESREKLNRLRDELGWTKTAIVEAAIARLAESVIRED